MMIVPRSDGVYYTVGYYTVGYYTVGADGGSGWSVKTGRGQEVKTTDAAPQDPTA